MDYSFEKDVKKRMNWTIMQWKAEGDTGKGFKRIVNSLKFWRGRLNSALRNNNVILTLHHSVRRVYPSLQTVAAKISSLNEEIIISGYAKFKNRRYLSITFDNLDMKNYVVNNLKQIEDCEVAYLHWVDEAVLDYISVEWLSDDTDLLLTLECIEKYMDIVSAQKETTTLANGTICTSGKVIFRGHIKSNIVIDDIPHVTKIDGLECLVIVQGRPVQCFICLKVGHRASQCLQSFCGSCKLILNKTHICSRQNINFALSSNNNNSQQIRLEEANQMESFSNSNVSEVLHREDISSRNLFWTSKVNVGRESGLIGQHDELVEKYEERLGGPSIAEELSNIGEQLGNQSNGKWFSGKCNSQCGNTSKSNVYIRQEEFLGDPNFVLVDTSTEESNSDEECTTNFYEQMENNLAELAQSSEVSRMLLKDSLKFMKTEESEQHLSCIDSKEWEKAKYLKMENEGTLFEDPMKETIEFSPKENIRLIIKSGHTRKKKKSKRTNRKH